MNMGLHVDNKTTYDGLEKYFFMSRFGRIKSAKNDSIEGVMNLPFIIDTKKINNKKVMDMFQKFIDTFNVIIYEKIREFVIDNTEGGTYDMFRDPEDEKNLNKDFLKVINSFLEDEDKIKKKEVTISVSVVSKNMEFEIKTLLVLSA